jgi:hypothetical protein
MKSHSVGRATLDVATLGEEVEISFKYSLAG